MSPSSRRRAEASRTTGRETPKRRDSVDLRGQARVLGELARDDGADDAIIDGGAALGDASRLVPRCVRSITIGPAPPRSRPVRKREHEFREKRRPTCSHLPKVVNSCKLDRTRLRIGQAEKSAREGCDLEYEDPGRTPPMKKLLTGLLLAAAALAHAASGAGMAPAHGHDRRSVHGRRDDRHVRPHPRPDAAGQDRLRLRGREQGGRGRQHRHGAGRQAAPDGGRRSSSAR